MKVLKKITINFNSDPYEAQTRIVNVSDTLSNMEVVQYYLNKDDFDFTIDNTSNWTNDTYQEVAGDGKDFIHTYSVTALTPIEL